MKRLTGAALALALLCAAAPALAADEAARLLALVNAFREEQGLSPLRHDAKLEKAARRHTADMAHRNYFAHVAPDGTDLADRLDAVGYDYAFGGENLAGGQETPEEAVEDWKNSPGHRETMLDPRAKEAGTAFLPNPEGEPIERLWTLVVGARR